MEMPARKHNNKHCTYRCLQGKEKGRNRTSGAHAGIHKFLGHRDACCGIPAQASDELHGWFSIQEEKAKQCFKMHTHLTVHA
eukprot:1159641-Pelagomonas_calceolata.AAC.8